MTEAALKRIVMQGEICGLWVDEKYAEDWTALFLEICKKENWILFGKEEAFHKTNYFMYIPKGVLPLMNDGIFTTNTIGKIILSNYNYVDKTVKTYIFAPAEDTEENLEASSAYDTMEVLTQFTQKWLASLTCTEILIIFHKELHSAEKNELEYRILTDRLCLLGYLYTHVSVMDLVNKCLEIMEEEKGEAALTEILCGMK